MNNILKVAILFFMFNSVAYSSQNESASTIARSQEMIDKENVIRERIDKNEKMFLRKAVIKGVTLVDIEKIKKILQPFQNHWITKDDIQLIIDSIAAIYKENVLSDSLNNISYKIHRNVLNITVKENNN